MSSNSKLGQLELGIEREHQPDRNFDRGGRSFYFFDLDDNVLFLSTSIYIFHKKDGSELALSTGEFGRVSNEIGKLGSYKDYQVELNDSTGSFRRFRDLDRKLLKKFMQSAQPFVQDLAEALGHPDFKWKGPSWNTFYHAAFNQRPVSVITARGHHPETIKEGLSLLVKEGHLSQPPNYLSVFPVSHPETRKTIGDLEAKWPVSRLKLEAIVASVDKAMETYGLNEHHRFGMSDDSPENLELIIEAMRRLKSRYPKNSFFVIDTHLDRYVKQEIFESKVESRVLDTAEQLRLLDE